MRFWLQPCLTPRAPLPNSAMWRSAPTYTLHPLVLLEATRGAMPVNRFTHIPQFPRPDSRQVIRPNADTLYSSAWLDLSKEPILIHVPDSVLAASIFSNLWTLGPKRSPIRASEPPGPRRRGSPSSDLGGQANSRHTLPVTIRQLTLSGCWAARKPTASPITRMSAHFSVVCGLCRSAPIRTESSSSGRLSLLERSGWYAARQSQGYGPPRLLRRLRHRLEGQPTPSSGRCHRSTACRPRV